MSRCTSKVTAVICTLVGTYRLNGINPETYLTDVIGRIGRTRIQALDTLLPFNWRLPDASRIYMRDGARIGTFVVGLRHRSNGSCLNGAIHAPAPRSSRPKEIATALTLRAGPHTMMPSQV
jgi:hypothetical protein